MTSSILIKGIAFFTTPIFTRMLGSEQYGLYSVFQFRLELLVCVMGLGLVSSIGTSIYEYKEDYYKYRSSALLLTTLSSFVFILISFLLLKPISKVLGYDSYLVTSLFFLSLFYVIVNFAQTAFIYEKKAVHNFVMSLLLSVVSVVASLLLISKMSEENKYLGMVFGQFIPYLVIAVAVWFLLFMKKPTLIKKEYTLYGLTYGIPIIFHLLSHSLLSQSDREMMIRMDISKHEIGVYSLYCALATVLFVILSALSNSWSPFFYDGIENEKWDELNKKCRNVVELFTIITIGFLLLSREVSYLIGPSEFWEGIDIIPILVVSQYFVFLYQFPVCYEFYYKKTKIVAIATATSALLNIALNFVMIRGWGMYGAGLSTALSYFVLFLIHYLFVRKMSGGKYHLKLSLFAAGFLLVLVGVAGFYLLSSLVILRWVLGACLGVFEMYRIVKRKSVF